MKVWVLRHGEAEPHARSDAQRNLTEHGRKQVLRSAAHLLGEQLDAIVVSPYVRAQQTASLVHDALGFAEPLVTVSWLTPESNPDRVIAELDALGLDNVLLVSHQPLVSSLLGLLVHGSRQSGEAMSTASLAELEGDGALAGLMTLRSLRHA
ncbi:MAG: phosphohistidine phosphatase SixA [Paucimonas sp.]|nr:phosphohistidine phosphatase SixA [Paucimonas sp.]